MASDITIHNLWLRSHHSVTLAQKKVSKYNPIQWSEGNKVQVWVCSTDASLITTSSPWIGLCKNIDSAKNIGQCKNIDSMNELLPWLRRQVWATWLVLFFEENIQLTVWLCPALSTTSHYPESPCGMVWKTAWLIFEMMSSLRKFTISHSFQHRAWHIVGTQ